MPSKTAKQHRAMAAAAAGHSTLGIPQSVGREFIRHDEKLAHLRKKRTKRKKH